MIQNQLPFIKMHGAGNDFIVLDARENAVDWFLADAEKVKTLCHRQFGIGCDQLIIIAKSPTATAEMKIYNNDGSIAGMCGNATRCVTKLLCEEQNVDAITLQVGTRLLHCTRTQNGFTTNMGKADFSWRNVPLAFELDSLNIDLGVVGLPLAAACSMGNPHCVLIVPSLAAIDVCALGSVLETHALFPQKANISFVEQVDKINFNLRVWERGAGLTLACGSGACATFATLAKRGLVDKEATIHMLGGTLHMAFDNNENILMTGPAARVASGVVVI